MRFTGNGITNCYPDQVEDFISITVLTLARAFFQRTRRTPRFRPEAALELFLTAVRRGLRSPCRAVGPAAFLLTTPAAGSQAVGALASVARLELPSQLSRGTSSACATHFRIGDSSTAPGENRRLREEREVPVGGCPVTTETRRSGHVDAPVRDEPHGTTFCGFLRGHRAGRHARSSPRDRG